MYLKELLLLLHCAGLQRMKSNTAEVRALVQVLSNKIQVAQLKEPLDAQAIGVALYGECCVQI